MSGTGGARDQVARLLTLVPYLYQRSEVRVDDAAAALGVTPEQVVKDLKVLFMVGLPGGYPDDLIDVDLDALEGEQADGVIRVSNADYLARPLRLTATEATALTVALLALRNGAAPETRELIDRVVGKLQAAAGAGAGPIPMDPGSDEQSAGLSRLRSDLERAIRDRRRVELTYWVPARDEETRRVVEPRRLLSSGGATYLDAWCRSAEDDRLFRLDRIHAATVLQERVDDRHRQPRGHLGPALFSFGDDAVRVTLRLAPEAAWVVEYYQVEDVRPQRDGGLEVDLLVADQRWLERLVLRLAPHAHVLAPEGWAASVSARARATRDLYPPRRTMGGDREPDVRKHR